MTAFEVVTTRSGAKVVRDTASGEVMHPGVGPVAEATGLYVDPARLRDRLKSSSRPLVVYDVGLGAGSNAAAAWRVSEERSEGAPLELVSFDRTTAALALALDHADDFGLTGGAGRAARDLLDTGEAHGAHTRWRRQDGDLPASLRDAGAPGDIVFWDPYSPNTNPELWTVAAFRTLRSVCAAGATVHTYSAATSTRSAMLLAGFTVGFGPATGTKQHTTMAATDPQDVHTPLDRRWLERLHRSSAPLPADAPGDALLSIDNAPQFRR